MQKIVWDEKKNALLNNNRGVTFEEILDSKFLGAEKHRTRANQMVPRVVEEKYIFFKTAFPSRKYTAMFKRKVDTARKK